MIDVSPYATAGDLIGGSAGMDLFVSKGTPRTFGHPRV